MEPNPPPIFTGAKSKIKRVHNLRTDLDHMVWELVGFAGAALRVVFPFDSNSNSMVALIFIGSLHNQCALSLRLTDILKALKVFPGGWLETRHKHSDRTSLGLGLLAAVRISKSAKRAKTDCEVAPINEKTFLFLVHETPFFAIAVMRALAGRLRHMNE